MEITRWASDRSVIPSICECFLQMSPEPTPNANFLTGALAASDKKLRFPGKIEVRGRSKVERLAQRPHTFF